MSRVFNFSPGPSTLPDEVMKTAQAEFYDYQNTGASIIELSHRGDIFFNLYQETEELLRRALNIPDHYWVLFLQGGATGQAAAIALNLTANTNQAAYAITGHWSKRAAEEAKKFCQVHIIADTSDSHYSTLPSSQWIVDDKDAYVHYADNETVHGIEFSTPPTISIPLVSDMSSNLLSRQIRVSDYALIYASAQKNIGPAGVTVVIVNPNYLAIKDNTPSIWNYHYQHQQKSMYNTPPTFQIYMVNLVLKWLKAQGGIFALQQRNEQKAKLLYDALDASDFYQTAVSGQGRSRMSVPFFLPNEKLTARFVDDAQKNQLIGLKGHRLLGGCRACIYNALPIEGVKALVDYLKAFEKRYA